MAKERMINTRIWSDTWMSNLDPIEKLLFLYFLTNTYTNISGIYELPMKVAAVETGIDPSMFEKILPHLEPKVVYKHGWVILPNFPKYQNTENPKIMAGIQRELSTVPKEIYTLSIAYGYPIALIPIPILNSTSAPSAQPVTVEKEDDGSKKESHAKYPHAKEVFSWFRKPQKSWMALKNVQEREYAEYLWERGEKNVKGAIAFCADHSEEEYFPKVNKPSDLEKKWLDIVDYRKKHSL